MKKYEPPFNSEMELPLYHNHATITQRYNYPNWHNNIEILYITEGEGSVLCGSVTHKAVAGDVFVINADNLHSATSNSQMKITYFIIENLFCKTNGFDVEHTNFLTHVKPREVAELCDKLVLALESNSSFKSAEAKSARLFQFSTMKTRAIGITLTATSEVLGTTQKNLPPSFLQSPVTILTSYSTLQGNRVRAYPLTEAILISV